MTPTSTSTTGEDHRVVPANPSPERTPDWLYNEIMRFVQPDLMTDRLPLLAIKYNGEPPSAKLAREAVYAEDFRIFDTVARQVSAPISEAGHKFLQKKHAQMQTTERAEQASVLESMEAHFSSAA